MSHPQDAHVPAGSSLRLTIEQLLETARAGLDRLSPENAYAAQRQGAILLDIRCGEERRRRGVIPGACWYPRNVLEWRVDPTSGHADSRLSSGARRLMLLCSEGYQSSLAAANLHQLGFAHATDVIGGFAAWHSVGLPVLAYEPNRDGQPGWPAVDRSTTPERTRADQGSHLHDRGGERADGPGPEAVRVGANASLPSPGEA